MKYGALDSIPRQTTIGGQPHMLAYINPEEESLIQDYRGNIPPVVGPNGVPAYLFGFSWGGGGGSSSSSSSSSSNDNNNDSGWSFSGIAESIGNAISTGVTAVGNFVSDVGQAAADTVVEIATFGTADTQTYNPTATATDTTATTATATTTDPVLEIRTLASGQKYSVDANGNFVALVGGVPQVFYDAMGNEYATRAEAINADEVAELSSTLANTGVGGPYDGGGFFDAFGNEYNSQEAASAADIMASAESKAGDGTQEAQDYADRFGTTYMEDRFRTLLIDPNTGTYYEPRDTNIVNPLDADTIPYAGSDNTYTNEEIQYFGGDPYSSTVGGVSLNDPFDDPRTEVIETEEDYTGTDPVDEDIDSGAYLAENFDGDDSYQRTREVRGTRDLIGDFIGGRSGGMWNRAPSYLTRFGYTPAGIDEMVRVVENADGTTSYYGADGALLNPELMEGVRLGGPTVSQKIGEENVLLGTQTLNPDGTVSDTAYTDLYDPELDAGLFNYS